MHEGSPKDAMTKQHSPTGIEKELDEYHLHADHQAVIRVWKALGITEYTGQHVAEHIEELKSQNEELRETLERVRAECERPANRGIHTLNQMCAFLDGLHKSITDVLESKQ